MAIRGTVSIGRQANSSLFTIPSYLKTRYHVAPASHPFHGPISHPHTRTAFKYSIRAIHEATADPVAPRKQDEERSSENWKIKMLYDGDCPLCMREVNMLRERNKRYDAIKFVDISSDEYSPKENQGLDYKTVMGRIHAVLSDGTVVTDVEAFRKLYEAVDLGWVYAITKYEPIATIADSVYGVWAKYRLQITVINCLQTRACFLTSLTNQKSTCHLLCHADCSYHSPVMSLISPMVLSQWPIRLQAGHL